MVASGWELFEGWRSGLEVLSLDFARPVYADLGIQLRFEETIRGMTRDTLMWRHPEGIAKTPASKDWKSSFYVEQVEPFLRSLTELYGLEARSHLEYWMRYTAYNEDSNPWTLYEEAFSVWGASLRRTGRDRFGLTKDAKAIHEEYWTITDIENVTAALESQRKRPLSDWDKTVFSRYGLESIPVGSDYLPLVDRIRLIVNMHRFQEFLRSLISWIDTESLRKINVFAEDLARRQRREFRPIEDLPLPHVKR